MDVGTGTGSGGAPRPGSPVRGSATGVPLMALFDLVGRRWALTCLWSLRDGPRTFREVQGVDARISPSTLNKRLAELRAARLVERGAGGYELTALGRELLDVGGPLVGFSERWAAVLDEPTSAGGPDAGPSA